MSHIGITTRSILNNKDNNKVVCNFVNLYKINACILFYVTLNYPTLSPNTASKPADTIIRSGENSVKMGLMKFLK